MRTTPGQRWAVVAVFGLLLSAAGVVGSLLLDPHAPGTGVELLVLSAFAVGSGLWLSFATPGPGGAIVVVNPAVCFTLAILLTWGLLPALSAHLASVIALTLRRRLPPVRGLMLTVQFVATFSAAYGVLKLDGRSGPTGREWTDLHDAAIVIAAAVAWLITYLAAAYLLSLVYAKSPTSRVPPPNRNGLVFNGALVVLSPVVAVAADTNVALAALVLVPLYATQRMARLAIERERANRQDSLTSLGNRVTLRESFDHLTGRREDHTDRRCPDQLALMVLDLDRFKYINDSLGFEVGDQLLVAVAAKLTDVHSGGETVVRLGGDEFAILACVPDASAANDLAARAVEALREPFRLEGLLVDVTASVGVTTRTDSSGEDFAVLLRHADAAMYDAKRRGDDVAVYQDEGDFDSPERLQLLTDFREALTAEDNDEISMHYQPQVSLATGAVDGLEALLRWCHPVRGPIDATTILGLAEHTTVMHLLTARVVDLVTVQLVRWREKGINPRVAVNISARDLYSENIIAQLIQRLEQSQLRPHQFQIEITESALMADPARARATLRRIADLGIDISLDDFGTGYSSLQHLRRMPVSEIKVDQTFVKGMTRNHDDAAIVAFTVNMAHSLGLRAVAEGVEDEPTMRQLSELGCDLGQGWHISHAVPHDRVPALIAERPPSTEAGPGDHHSD